MDDQLDVVTKASYVATPGSTRISDAAGVLDAHRRGDIQGLRAVAVLLVIVFHAGVPLPGGFVGVDVFFVISGFVITAMLLREWDRTGSLRFGRFYWRRFKRLSPALALLVTVTLVLALAILSPLGPLQTSAATGAGAMVMAANVVISQTSGGYFQMAAESNAFLNTWSLSVEEQFYLVFPAVLLLSLLASRRAGGSRLPVLGGLVLGLVLSLTLMLVIAEGLWEVPLGGALVGFYSPFTRAWEFAAGAILAAAAPWVGKLGSRASLGIGLLGAGGLVVSSLAINSNTVFPGLATLVPVAGTTLLLAAGFRHNLVSDQLSRPTMQWIGDRSYAIYLWHWPAVVLATALLPFRWWVPPLATAVSLFPAFLSYRWVESPLRNLKSSSKRSAWAIAMLTLGIPLFVAVTVWGVASLVRSSPDAQSLRLAADQLPFHTNTDCARLSTRSLPLDDTCTWNAVATGEPVYVLGDSNAGQYAEAILGAAQQLNRPVTFLVNGGCPFGSFVFAEDGKPSRTDECAEATRRAADFLSTAPVGDVITASASLYFSAGSGYAFGEDATTLSYDERVRLNVYGRGLADALDPMVAAGHRVLVLQGIPLWEGSLFWSPQTCTVLQIWSSGCSAEVSAEQVRNEQSGFRRTLASVAANGGFEVADPIDWLCPEGVCSTSASGFVRYHDANHMSVEQSKQLVDEFVALLNR